MNLHVIRRKYLLHELTVDDSFIRWASGEASPEESRRWDRWVEYSEENRELAIRAQRHITGIRFDLSSEGLNSTADLHSGDESLSTRESLNSPGELSRLRQEDWLKVKSDILKKRTASAVTTAEDTERSRSAPDRARYARHSARSAKKRGPAHLLLKVAALLLVMASAGVAGFYALKSSDHTVSEQLSAERVTVATDFTEKKTISLSDGSEIILAAGSRISYREDWLHQPTLKVTLEKGEAYFSIVPDENRDRSQPRFEVETEDGITAVLGTKFSVTTYGEGTQVVLEQGEVEVIPSQTEGGGEQVSVRLQPGELARWSKVDSEVLRSKINPRVYTSWVSDHLYFDDTPLSFLVDRIEKTYGVEVVVVDPGLLNLKLSGAVDFYGLDELAGAISEVLDIQLHHSDDQVFLTR